MPPIDLTSQSIVVLGGSGALGSRIAERLAQRGAYVVLAARNRDRLEQISARIPGSTIAPFDLRDPAQASVPADVAIEANGALHGIVNAAGAVAFGPLADTDPSVIDEIVEVDLTGPLRVYRAAIGHMNEGGFIVNLTGVVASMPTAGMATYSAAKAGLSAATLALARELRRDRITVIDAQPPHTETGLVDRAIAGSPPNLPAGLSPDAVADRVVAGIEAGDRSLPADAFA